LADAFSLVKVLKTDYGLPVCIHDAVEGELRFHAEKKFKRLAKPINKALDSDALRLLTPDSLAEWGFLDAEKTLDGIGRLGKKYGDYVDRGEAYSYAMANLLRAPILSNDASALADLVDGRITVPAHTLRAFDFFVFGCQTARLSARDCDVIRKTLVSENEFVPHCFKRSSFEDGLPNFFARLLDQDCSPIGSTQPIARFDVRLWLSAQSIAGKVGG
jgi:hypothetical protein